MIRLVVENLNPHARAALYATHPAEERRSTTARPRPKLAYLFPAVNPS